MNADLANQLIILETSIIEKKHVLNKEEIEIKDLQLSVDD